MNTTKYFFYGIFMHPANLANLGVTDWQPAVLQDWRRTYEFGPATLVPCPGELVIGVVASVPEASLAGLVRTEADYHQYEVAVLVPDVDCETYKPETCRVFLQFAGPPHPLKLVEYSPRFGRRSSR